MFIFGFPFCFSVKALSKSPPIPSKRKNGRVYDKKSLNQGVNEWIYDKMTIKLLENQSRRRFASSRGTKRSRRRANGGGQWLLPQGSSLKPPMETEQ